MPRFVDRTGVRYGRLVAVRHTKYDGRIRWLCRCDCGNETWVASDRLGIKTNSCGCLQRERASASNSTHGYTRPGDISPTYLSWQAAKGRCYNPNNDRFEHYGGRGITMCKEWLENFEQFLADMGHPPPGLTLDRIDVNGNYEKTNCRWATRKEQSDTRRRTIWVDGLPLKDFADKHGVPYKSLHYLVRRRGRTPHDGVREIMARQ